MKRASRILTVCVAAFMGQALLMQGQASASIVLASSDLGAWTSLTPAGGDKTFTLISSSNLPSDVHVTVKWNDLNNSNPLDDRYSLNLAGDAISTLPQNTTFDLYYKIDIISGSLVFASAELDANHQTDNSTVTKDVYSDANFSQSLMPTLTVLNGAPAVAHSISGLHTTIYVHDRLVLDAGGNIDGLTNTFTQQVPEPASLCVWSGIAGLAFVLNRRRKT